jgi:hypothetical protein
MRLNIAKTCVVSYTRKTNFVSYDYQLCHATITRTSSIKDLGVFFDSKLHFHNHVDYIFSECIKLLGIIRSITFTFSSLECLYTLYLTLVRSKLEYASVVWNYNNNNNNKNMEACLWEPALRSATKEIPKISSKVEIQYCVQYTGVSKQKIYYYYPEGGRTTETYISINSKINLR